MKTKTAFVENVMKNESLLTTFVLVFFFPMQEKSLSQLFWKF